LYKESLKQDPDDVGTLVALASLHLFFQRELSQAKNELERALSLSPHHPGALVHMATYHFLFEDDTETATDMLRHVIRQDPSKFRYYLQQTHLRCGRLGDLVRRILREENLTGTELQD